MACLTVKRLLSFTISLSTIQIMTAQGGHQLQHMCGFVDYILAGHSFNESIAQTQKLCYNMCLHHAYCKSTNYFLKTRLCALNNVSHLDSSLKLLAEPGSFYAFSESLSGCAIAPVSQRVHSEAITEQDLSLVDMSSEQSSNFTKHHRLIAKTANDGDTNTVMLESPYCSHTDLQSNPWWRVDLGGEHWLSRVTVLIRRDCCGLRLTGATVRAGLSPIVTSNKACGSAVTAAQATDGALIEFMCDPCTLARYLSVDIHTGGTNVTLELCEVTAKEYIEPKCCGA